jgi:hypothetical protein
LLRCESLRSIIIPASVTTNSGSAFIGCHLENIYIEEGNSNFRVHDQFLLDFSGRSLIRYFGCESSICTSRVIEVLSSSSFN